MSIHKSTRVQAYQLRKGGTFARMAILRMIAAESVRNANPTTRLAPGDWRGARSWKLNSYESAFAFLSAGKQDGSPVWCSHAGAEFRNERDAHDIVRGLPSGWFTDTDANETAIGIVAGLSHGRFIAGYRWTSNDERVYFPQVFSDESDAARMADEHARVFAESAREYSERFEAMSLAELDAEEKQTEFEKAFALRHRAKFGGPDRVRSAIEALRAARETLSDATRCYGGAA